MKCGKTEIFTRQNNEFFFLLLENQQKINQIQQFAIAINTFEIRTECSFISTFC